MDLFWAVYKNIKKESLSRVDNIHFDDKQSYVYSIRIAKLLIRAASEIEAISKYLYEINGGNMNPFDDYGNPKSLYFDSDCIQDLDLKWGVTKKIVNVVAPYFYYEKAENCVLIPLKECNKHGSGRWKKV